MATKKSDSKTTNSAKNSDKVEARPIGEGKDPLADGNTLENPSNTEAETHYDVKERSDDVRAREAQNTIDGQDANERAEDHNTELTQGAPSHDTPQHGNGDQESVAAGRVE